MRKSVFLLFITLTSVRLFSQSSVGVPHYIDAGLSADKWQVIDPVRVQAVDGRFVESKLLRGGQANLYFRSFGFAIPSTATIDGIDVRITRKKKGPNNVQDVTVALLKPINETEATGKAPNLAKSDPWTETITTVLYSFPKDAVDGNGNTFQWTPAEVNKPAFGLFFGTSVGNGKGAYILFDKVELTVRYSVGTTVTSQSSSIESSSIITLKQLGNRWQVKTEKGGRYLFTVRDRSGALLQQTSFEGGKSTMMTLEGKCKGYCIVTVEGNGARKSIIAIVQ
jgi:hypothetical protein